MGQVHYLQVKTDQQLEQILQLQRRNTVAALSIDEVAAQGFVTVQHDLDLLREMNQVDQHIIALRDQRVIGYALVMQREFEARLPILKPLFGQIRSLTHNGRSVEDYRYFIMGQVCVAKPFRGQGVFEGLYQCMRRCYGGRYDFVITEVATRNQRSIRAHEKVGFRLLRSYKHGEQWDLIYWDWQEE
jgi:RimJ/RimL family protein N-acetyltransferase